MASLLTFAALLAALQPDYSHGDPSDQEQLILEMINRARRNPTAEGGRLGVSMTEGLDATTATYLMPRPPLALNADLSEAALSHLENMYADDFFDHVDQFGDDEGDRIADWGYVLVAPATYSENLATSPAGPDGSPAGLQDLLMKDAGVVLPVPRAHRRTLLDIFPPNAPVLPLRQIGISYADKTMDKSEIKRHILVQDFGSTAGNAGYPGGPFLVGVVFDDADVDNFYAPGEGEAAVRIRIPGYATWRAITSTSGGYALPVAGAPTVGDGYVRVIADQGFLGVTQLEKRFYPNGLNVKIDFLAGDLVDTDLDGMPDYWENLHVLNPAVDDSAADVDADLASNLDEYLFGSDPNNVKSTPKNPLGVTAPAGGDDEEPEGCGALGVEFLLVLAARALLRRNRRGV